MLKPVLLAALSILATYLYQRLHFKRFKQYANFPQLPTGLLLGHLKVYDDFTRRGKVDRHPDAIFSEMHDSLGSPPVMLVDLRPVNAPMLLITNHELAEQVSRASDQYPTSLPKTSLAYLEPLVGERSILAAHGQDWKQLRRKFNPGFAPQHLMTLLPSILARAQPFIHHLDSLVESGAEFSMVDCMINLTFDIIGAVVLDVNLYAQARPGQRGELINLYDQLIQTYTQEKGSLPWWLIPQTALKRRRLGQRIDSLISETIRLKHKEQHQPPMDPTTSRSIVALSLKDTDELSPELIRTTCDQIKTFLLAGHDTTSTTLAWLFYELSRTPHALEAVRTELNEIFGPDKDPEIIRAKLISPQGPNLIHQMIYVSAALKETLRMHPPAGTARMGSPGVGFKIHTRQGDEYCLDNLTVYICHSIIHRDKSVYGKDVDEFVPERWLSSSDGCAGSKSAQKSNEIPPGSWRPFERGPRNCIGQEFATIESRVIIALVARRYDFCKIGLGQLVLDSKGSPYLQSDGQYSVKSELYNTCQVTNKPVDGMRMKVRLSN